MELSAKDFQLCYLGVEISVIDDWYPWNIPWKFGSQPLVVGTHFLDMQYSMFLKNAKKTSFCMDDIY